MRFVEKAGVWHLVAGESPGTEEVLATLRSEVEIVALREFCTYFAADCSKVPERFHVIHEGTEYTVVPLGGSGENLTLLISGTDGTTTRVDTKLVLRPERS